MDTPTTWIPRTHEEADEELEHRQRAIVAEHNRIAKRLRDLADSIEQGNDPLHEVPWGFANLNLSTIARLVAERDYMRGVVMSYRANAEKEATD